MSEENSAFSATLKGGASFDSPWLVIRADTAAQLKERLREAYSDLVGPLVLTANVFAEEYSGGKPAPVTAPAPVQNFAPAQQAAPTGGQAPVCVHGTTKWVEARPDSGKTWKGWFCPAPREATDKCKPIFVK